MFKERIQSISNSDRNLLIALLRESVDSIALKYPVEARVMNTIPLVELAMLGDDWAMTQRVNEFLTHGTRSAPTELLLLNSPKVIPLIGEGLFKDENEQTVGDIHYSPTQETIKLVILHTLTHSSEFSSDVAGWARRVSVGDTVATVRNWYRANETKLRAGNFKAVEAGPEPSPSKRVPQQLATPAPLPQWQPAKASAPVASGNGYLWLSVIILVVGGGLVWILGTKRKS